MIYTAELSSQTDGEIRVFQKYTKTIHNNQAITAWSLLF